MAGDYELEEPAVPESLDRLQDLLARVAEEHPEVGTDDLMMFETAAVELVGNVVEHGRPPGQVHYRFRLRVLPDRLVAEVTDTSEVAAAAERREMPSPWDEAGRGLPLAGTALDELTCERVGRGNRWRLTRLLRG